MISKSISVSKKLAQISQFGALLFTWIIPHCDDGGNMPGDAFTVKGLVVPVRPETVADVEKTLKELIEMGLLDPYEANGEKYIHIINWNDHQTLRADRQSWEYPRYGKDERPRKASTKAAADGSFEKFYALYPRKVARAKAEIAWKQIKPELHAAILEAVKAHSQSEQWTRDDGKFIPHPATWLHQKRWNDVLTVGSKVQGKYDSVGSTKA